VSTQDAASELSDSGIKRESAVAPRPRFVRAATGSSSGFSFWRLFTHFILRVQCCCPSFLPSCFPSCCHLSWVV